jgi:predicted NACHT family NTPase
LLSQGRLLLLIDGLNELPSEIARTELSAFRRQYAQAASMVFTTRDLSLGGDLGIDKKLEMQPLTEAQIQAFIHAYVPEQADLMMYQMSERLLDFGRTPLLLWMLCEFFKQSPQKQMPSNLAELFRDFTTIYEESSVRKHDVALLKGDVRPLSDRRLWKPALEVLAFMMIQGENSVGFRVVIRRDEAEQVLRNTFTDEKCSVRDIVDDLLKYHLLQNHSTDKIEFRHQLLQEYYAAENLLKKLPKFSDQQLKQDYLNYLKWTEPISLMLSLLEEEAQALRVVRLAMHDIDLLLGARLAGQH